MDKNKLKIYAFYHDINLPLFKNDILQPMLNGACIKVINKDFIGDNTGDNISHKNKNFAEYSGMYWVWKNYLKENKDLEYIGFCHYRRFLDFFKKPKEYPFKNIFYKRFDKYFFKKIYNYKNIYHAIKEYDIILPNAVTFQENLYEQYISGKHPKEAIDNAIKIIEEKYPEYAPFVKKTLNNNYGYFCNIFIAKKEIFDEYMSWVTSILFALEPQLDLSKYITYETERVFAYLAERLFNVWLECKIETSNIKILERHSYFLTVIYNIIFSFGQLNLYRCYDKIYMNIFNMEFPINIIFILRWMRKKLKEKLLNQIGKNKNV